MWGPAKRRAHAPYIPPAASPHTPNSTSLPAAAGKKEREGRETKTGLHTTRRARHRTDRRAPTPPVTQTDHTTYSNTPAARRRWVRPHRAPPYGQGASVVHPPPVLAHPPLPATLPPSFQSFPPTTTSSPPPTPPQNLPPHTPHRDHHLPPKPLISTHQKA